MLIQPITTKLHAYRIRDPEDFSDAPYWVKRIVHGGAEGPWLVTTQTGEKTPLEGDVLVLRMGEFVELLGCNDFAKIYEVV